MSLPWPDLTTEEWEKRLGDLHKKHLADWNESLHPRDEAGKFAESGADRPGFRKLVDQIKQPDGGFTVHAVTGDQPTKGYALSIYKGRETILPVAGLKLAHLARFAKDNHDLLKQPDHYFGAWHNPDDGKVYLDVSKVVKTELEAERQAREHKQIAYFDLEHGRSVNVQEAA